MHLDVQLADASLEPLLNVGHGLVIDGRADFFEEEPEQPTGGHIADGLVHVLPEVALDPLAATTHYHLGFAAARTGEFHRAQDAWSTYLRLEDGDAARRENAERARAAADALLSALDLEVG